MTGRGDILRPRDDEGVRLPPLLAHHTVHALHRYTDA